MTETQHTPGPWEYDGEYIWADSIQGYVADPNTDDMTSGKYLPTSKAQAAIEANGRLIAAAPDLLKILKAVSDWHKGTDFTDTTLFSEIDAAIARAEGK